MTAVLLVPATAPKPEWLAARRNGIGASEMAAVMGISPYDSPFSLWWRKHMGWDTDTNAEMRTGSFLEPAIASWFEENGDPNEQLAMEYGGLYASEHRPWQLATPDRILHLPCPCCTSGPCGCGLYGNCAVCLNKRLGSPPVGLLECKWVAYSWDGWGDDGASTIPIHYRAQVQQQMDVMETEDVFVCALGPGGFRTFRVRRDETDLKMMRAKGERFMESLAAGIQPDLDDHAATLPMVRRLHAEIEDRDEEIPETIATGWLRSKRFKDLAARAEKRYAALLRNHLGTAKTAVLNGRKFATRTSDDKLTRSKAK